MPIILNGELHDPNKPIVEATPRPIVDADVVEPETGKGVDKQHHIVVNGKKKKLGVKSAYMLDMLTIE